MTGLSQEARLIEGNKLKSSYLIAGKEGQVSNHKNAFFPKRRWHLTINLRLILGSTVIILLVGCMSIFSLWATGGLLEANGEVSSSLKKSASFQVRVAEVGQWRQQIDRTQAELNLVMRSLIADLVGNRDTLNGFSEDGRDPLGAFLESSTARKIKQQRNDTKSSLQKLEAAHRSIMTAGEKLQATWRPRHGALSEKLSILKRHINYWNLKVANTFFIRSSMLEIMPEEIEDTPLEEFRNSETFKKYAPKFPILNDKIRSAAETNEALFEASGKLGSMALSGDWDKVRNFYRDNFPPMVKSILVDIDSILEVEQQSLYAQQRAMDVMNGPLNEASAIAATELTRLQETLAAMIQTEKQNLQTAASEVMVKRDTMESAISRMRQINIIAPALVILIASIGGLIMTRSVSRPLRRTVEKLNEIASGGGDLTQKLHVRSGDEVGQLAIGFNKFTERQREMVNRLRIVSNGLISASDQIRETANNVSSGATEQTSALKVSEQSLKDVLEDARGIAESAHNLVGSSRQCTSATLELGATIEEISEQMENLFSKVEVVSSSTQEMSASSSQIDENVQALVVMSQQTTQAVKALNQRTGKIEESAITTGELSAQAAEDAGRGLAAVEASLEGINKMSEVINRAGVVIRDLSDQSRSIDQILTVIDEVADQTSLLALNATIIAAQAGERGQAFGVVADEIRDLATRTATSTKEIATIIKGLQDTAAEAVDVVETGRQRADKEVVRAQDAGQALGKIRQSTKDARWHMVGIVESAREQVGDSQQINASSQEITNMLSQIAVALQQLSAGIKQTAKSSDDMREIAGRVKSSTEEQSAGSKQIAANMETIREMINRIDEATRDQSRRTEETVISVTGIHRIAESTVLKSGEMEQVVALLKQQTDTLDQEMGNFKV
jgi:methyl-accepting chemotaxis protein